MILLECEDEFFVFEPRYINGWLGVDGLPKQRVMGSPFQADGDVRVVDRDRAGCGYDDSV